MLTLGCNDSNFLPLCASIHSLPHNKWMEMRGNKRMRWNHFQSHYIYFPPISLVKCCARPMITNTRKHKHACGPAAKTQSYRSTHSVFRQKYWEKVMNKHQTCNICRAQTRAQRGRQINQKSALINLSCTFPGTFRWWGNAWILTSWPMMGASSNFKQHTIL